MGMYGRPDGEHFMDPGVISGKDSRRRIARQKLIHIVEFSIRPCRHDSIRPPTIRALQSHATLLLGDSKNMRVLAMATNTVECSFVRVCDGLRCEVIEPLAKHDDHLITNPSRALSNQTSHVGHFRLGGVRKLMKLLQQTTQTWTKRGRHRHTKVAWQGILNLPSDIIQIGR